MYQNGSASCSKKQNQQMVKQHCSGMLEGAFLLPLLILATYASVGLGRLAYMDFHPMAPTPADLSAAMDNQHIVFVGDSLLRYQYISLLNVIHSNLFVPNNVEPNVLLERSFKTWVDFYSHTSRLFYPLEYCDCYRKEILNPNFASGDMYENRYYQNKLRNISLSYIQYFGDKGIIHGHWSPNSTEGNDRYHPPDQQFVPPLWQYTKIHDVLTNIASKLTPKPTTLVLNAGMHKHNYLEVEHRISVLDLALTLFDRVIWKTTGGMNDQTPGSTADDIICQHPGIECLHLNWTFLLTDDDYADRIHPKSYIYNDITIQMVQQLTSGKEVVYSTVPRSMAAEGSVVEVIDVTPAQYYVVDDKGRLRRFAQTKETQDSANPCSALLQERPRVKMVREEMLKYLVGYPVDFCQPFNKYTNVASQCEKDHYYGGI